MRKSLLNDVARSDPHPEPRPDGGPVIDVDVWEASPLAEKWQAFRAAVHMNLGVDIGGMPEGWDGTCSCCGRPATRYSAVDRRGDRHVFRLDPVSGRRYQMNRYTPLAAGDAH